jgi:hypothetical protein
MITQSIIIAIITSIVGPSLVLFAKYYLDKRSSRGDMVQDAAKLGEHVSGRLDSIKEMYTADRVWISQFHNGGHFYPTGKSIAKFSVFYETVNLDVQSIQTTFHNVPVALFARSINQLLENDLIKIEDYSNKDLDTYGLKYVAEENKTKSQYLFAVKTFEGKFIGILGIDYTKRKRSLHEDELTDLKVSAASIGGILINHLRG